MKRKLDDEAQRILHLRIDIARVTRIFTIGEVAKGFQIDRMTVYRNIDPKLREKSREYAKKKRLSTDTTVCHKCGTNKQDHDKCTHCRIFLHEHGLSSDTIASYDPFLCSSCLKNYLRSQSRLAQSKALV